MQAYGRSAQAAGQPTQVVGLCGLADSLRWPAPHFLLARPTFFTSLRIDPMDQAFATPNFH